MQEGKEKEREEMGRCSALCASFFVPGQSILISEQTGGLGHRRLCCSTLLTHGAGNERETSFSFTSLLDRCCQVSSLILVPFTLSTQLLVPLVRDERYAHRQHTVLKRGVVAVGERQFSPNGYVALVCLWPILTSVEPGCAFGSVRENLF